MILGVLGFAIGGFGGFADPAGANLIVFRLNPLQNLIHLGMGWWLVRSGASATNGARALLVTAVASVAMGILGLISATATPMALNGADDLLHLVVGVAALAGAASASSKSSRVCS